jgi:hypothetical protein
MRNYIIFFLFFSCCSSNLFGIINYESAFNFTKIDQKYKALLESLGCADNIFESKQNDIDEYENYENETYIPINVLVDQKDTAFQKYTDECLSHLYLARRINLLRPIISYGSIIISLGGLTAGLTYVDPSAWTFTVIYFACYSVFALKELAPSIVEFFSPSNHVLYALEEEFAINHSFIPKALWQSIISHFALAAQNPTSNNDYIKYIKFVLGLKTYQNRKIDVHQDNLIETIKSLDIWLKNYFDAYQLTDKNDIDLLGASIAQFITQLYAQKPKTTCIVLTGLTGSGKTHFVEKLHKWLKKNIFFQFYFDRAQIQSKEDLEGTTKEPGILLKTYQRIVGNPKNHGGILYLDEFTFDNPDLISTIKRVVNGDQTKIPSIFLKQHILEEFELNLMPILIIISNNQTEKLLDLNTYEEDIKAIAGRMNIINFPLAKSFTITNFGQKLLKESPLYLENYDEDEALERELEKATDFREAEKIVSNNLYKRISRKHQN